MSRVETGPVQFGDDWPGVFIRGDNAFAYSMALSDALEQLEDPLLKAQLEGLRQVLSSSDARGSLEGIRHIKDFT